MTPAEIALEDRLKGAIVSRFEGMGEAWTTDESGDTLARAAAEVVVREFQHVLPGRPTLWRVEIDEADWDYDRFASCVVWAYTAEEAEQIVRAADRHPGQQDDPIMRGKWIEDPEWKLHVTRAPLEGIALAHWHAG